VTKKASITPSFNITSLIPLALVLLTAILYANVRNSQLQYSWDDNRYIVENPLIRDFSIGGFINIVTDFPDPYFAGYLPTTITAYWVQFRLWDVHPTGYFVVNLLLHALNGVLVYWFLHNLTGNRAVAVIGAVLFIAHPVNVESVAWASELKNVLSMTFFLSAWLAHMRSNDSSKELPWLVLSYVLFLLGIFAKPVAVGAVILFMLYDFWSSHQPLPKIVIRNFAYGIIGGLGAITMLFSHSSGGGIKEHLGRNILENIALNLRIFWDYFASILVPTNLNNMYVYRIEEVLAQPLPILLGLLLLVGMVLLAIWQPLGKPFCAFAVAWVVITILPVSNIVPIAIQRADRYMYYPSVMLFMLVGMVALLLWERFRSMNARYAMISAGAGVCAILGLLTLQRVSVWENTVTLWRDHLEDYPNGQSSTGLLNLSVGYFYTSDYQNAGTNLVELLRYYPQNYKGNRLMGLNFLQIGDYRNAIAFLQRATELAQASNIKTDIQDELGIAYFQEGLNQHNNGQYTDALALYSRALENISQDNVPLVMNNVGFTLQTIGRFDDAILAFNSAVAIDPNYARAYINLGEVYLYKEDFQNSRDSYQKALSLGNIALNAKGNSNLCLVKAELGDPAQETLNFCQLALNEEPQNGLYLGRTAHVLLLYGENDRARQIAQTAIDTAPTSLAYRALGDALSRLGDATNAINAYRQALALDGNNQKAKDGLVALGVTP
jgi:protein O-mannosyl-transferase